MKRILQKTQAPTQQLKEAAETQIRELQNEIKYDLRDFTVDYLVDQFGEGLFYIPEYQREFVWPEKHRSKFIESILLGFPIPMLFVADMEDGNLEIVDGAQRIQTLVQFLNNDLKLNEVTLLTALKGFKFEDLPAAQQKKFRTRALRMIVLEGGTKDTIRQELFHRINTQSVRAKGSEIRRGSFQGPFVTFINRLAKDPVFLRICPISSGLKLRRENEELVTRFFCYSDNYEDFRHDVEKFLNEYVKQHRDDQDIETREREFHSVMRFVSEHFPNGFAKNKNAKTTPRVRFEAIAVGVNLALREKPDLIPSEPIANWLGSIEFQTHTRTDASNSGPRLRARVNYVRDRLLDL